MPDVLGCSYHMFADDVQIYTSCRLADIDTGTCEMNLELEKVQ